MKATPTNSLVWGSVVTLLFAVMVVEASHFRYAHISWTRAPGTRTVTFVAETGWRQGAIDGNFGLNTGDGNYVNPSSYITLGTINSAAGPFDLVRATFVYTYQGDGPYTAQYTSCCRIGTLTISAGQSWLVETLVNLANNNNFSPTSGLPAVVAFKKGGIVTTSIPNTDLDSSAPLQCSLQGSTYGIVGYPIGLTVSSNCILSFDTSDSSIVVGNTYPVNIQVLDPTPGMSSFINVDFMIAITSNGGPSCTPVSQSVSVSCCGGACATTSTTFVVTDPDGDPVSWSLLSAVPGHSVSPGTSVPSGSTATITFTPPGGWVGPVSSGTLTIQDSFSNIGYCPYNFNSLASVMAVAITPNANPGNCPGYTLRCAGDNTASLTATVTGTCGAVTYSWSPGSQNTATISNLGAGTYTVSVNDGVQTATASYTITAPTPYTTSLTRTSAAFTCGHFQCNGQATASLQFTASGGSCNLGNPLPVLTWAGPVGIANNVAAPTGLVAGTYTATFQDSNNCPYVNTITLTQPSALSYTLSQTGNCGGVSLTAAVSGGCSPYTISWTSSSGTVPSGFTPSGLPSGTYTGTVTDANGCQLVRSITVSYTPLSVLIDAVDKTCGHITCDDSTDGALQSFVSGSCGPYTYVWTSSPGATVIPTGTVNPTGLKAGSYYLTVTDNGGNSLRSNTEILAAPSDLMISLTQYPKVCGHITCRGSSDGRLTVNQLAPGCGTINLSWASTGTAIANNNFNPTGLGPGTYTPTVTDANGCSFTAPSVSISQPATALTVAVTQFPRSCGHIICNGDANGRLLVTPAGGCAGYSITWTSTGTPVAPGNFNPTNLRPGVYTPTVTDQNGCTVTPGSYTIAEPSTVLTGSISQSSCGQLTLSVSGGCGPYTYSWTTTGGSGLNPTSQNQAGPLSPGTYQVVVTDANGCSITRSFTIQPLAIDSGMSVVASDWGNSGSPPVVGSPWVRGPQPDQVTSATLQFAVYPSDFTVLQTPSISLRITALSGTVTGLWGIAMGYTGPASPYYLLTWNGVSSIPGCSAVTPGLKLLYVPAGSSACSIAEVSNGVILLESSASYGHTAWPAVTPLDFVLLYNTGVNVIRASVGGVAQFLFSSTVGHSLNAAVPTSLIAGGKWGLVTFSQDNVLFSKLARDAVVTTCPDAALAVVRKNFSGVSLCSAANSDISVNWGDSTPVETYTGGTAIVSFNSGSNTGTLQVQHRYATQGSYTVTVCVVASFGSSSACDSFIVSVSDLFTVGVTKKNMLMYTKGMLNWDTVTTGVDPMVRGELREKPARGGAVAMVLGTSSYSSGEMHLEAIHGILPGKYDLHLVLIAGACDFADSPIDFCVYLPFGENKCN